MITFSNIPESTQKTLFDKMNMLEKNDKVVSAGETLTDESGDIKKNYMFSRSVFMRMISLSTTADEKPVVLMGGELDSFGNLAENFQFQEGPNATRTIYDTISDRGAKYVGTPISGHEQKYRPLPGVKDVNIEFKGGGRTMGATRAAEVNWTCWSWEELDRLTKHFLHHGETIFIDWGWSGVGDLQNIELFPILEVNDDGETQLIKLQPGRDLLKELPNHVVNQNGNYDALIGIVKDFSWSVREDGGFDCVTSLVAPGISVLEQDVKKSSNPSLQTIGGMFKDMRGSSVEKVTEKMGAIQNMLTGEFGGLLSSGNVMTEEEAITQVDPLQWLSPAVWVGAGVSLGIDFYQYLTEEEEGVASFGTGEVNHVTLLPVVADDVSKEIETSPFEDKNSPLHMGGSSFPGVGAFENKTATTEIDKNTDGKTLFKGGTRFNMMYNSTQGTVAAYSPFLTFDMYMDDLPNQLWYNILHNENIMQGGHILRFMSWFTFGTMAANEEVGIDWGGDGWQTAKFNPGTWKTYEHDEMYVTWGWFEDNVLSRFFSKVEMNIVLGQFRSIERIVNEETGEEEVHPIKIRNHEKLITTDFSKFLLLKNESDFSYMTMNESWADPNKWTELDGRWRAPIEGYGMVGLNNINSRPFELDENGKKFSISPLMPFKPIEGMIHNFDDPEDPNSGILRNVYFNARYLKEKMANASSVQQAILNVWDGFSDEYGGIYNFGIDWTDDMNTVQVKDNGWVLDPVLEKLNNKSHQKDPDALDEKDKEEKLDGLFEFPTWQKSSMVKSQNMEARLPDRMQLVAMYGAQNMTDGDETETLNEDEKAGLAWSRILGNKDLTEEGLTAEEARVKLRKSVLGGQVDYPYKNNLPFGRADADINQPLIYGGKAGSQDGTIIYESILDELMKKEYDKYKKANREVGEEDITTTDEELKAMKLDDFHRKVFNGVVWGADFSLPEFQSKYQVYKKNSLIKFYLLFDGINERVESNDVADGSPWNKTHDIIMKSPYKKYIVKELKGNEGLSAVHDPIIPIELELEIDGTSAIFPGNAFQSSYIPGGYRDRACFQVKGVSHKIDSSGWSTTLNSQIRASMGKLKSEEKEEITKRNPRANEEAALDKVNKALDQKSEEDLRIMAAMLEKKIAEDAYNKALTEGQESGTLKEIPEPGEGTDTTTAQTPVINPSVSIANIAIGTGGQAMVDGQLLWKDEAMTDPVYNETLTAQVKHKPMDIEGMSKGDIAFQMDTSADGSLIKIGISENGVSAEQFTQMMPGISNSIMSSLPAGSNIDALMINIYDNVTAPGSSGTTISIPTGG